MKAMTLTQPWASLVALGEKRIETRSWSTTYRGPLAIHAAKGWPVEAAALCSTEPFRTALVAIDVPGRFVTEGKRGVSAPDLPRSVIVATCRLADCLMVEPTPEVRRIFADHAAPHDKEFGDYTLGRYMWLLADVVALPEPIPARGALGLWEWTGQV